MRTVGTITWLPDGARQEALAELPLLVHAMMEEREHEQACGGHAECGTCRVRVLAGAANLTPPTGEERELRERHPEALAADQRLACQCRPTGDVTVEVPVEPLADLRLFE